MTPNIHMLESNVEDLGFGSRYVIWTQGCDRRPPCPRCVAPDAQSAEGGCLYEAGDIAMEALISGCEGLTVSGGEPFMQSEPLCEVIDLIRARKDMGVIIYTGRIYEELLRDARARKLLERCDILIDGPYYAELDDGLSLRGSSNQRIIALTDRYVDMIGIYSSRKRTQSMRIHGPETHIIGIPSICTGQNEEY